jgi:parB_part: ParB-like partition proteins
LAHCFLLFRGSRSIRSMRRLPLPPRKSRLPRLMGMWNPRARPLPHRHRWTPCRGWSMLFHVKQPRKTSIVVPACRRFRWTKARIPRTCSSAPPLSQLPNRASSRGVFHVKPRRPNIRRTNRNCFPCRVDIWLNCVWATSVPICISHVPFSMKTTCAS